MLKLHRTAPGQSKINAKASSATKQHDRKPRPFAFGNTPKSGNLRFPHRLRSESPVDLVIADLTSVKSMTKSDAETLMLRLHGVVKIDGPILLAANGLVGAALIGASSHYKYSIIFEVFPACTANPSAGPVQNHVEYFVFYDKQPCYNPQKTSGHMLKVVSAKTKEKTALSRDPITGGIKQHTDYASRNRNPRSVLRLADKALNGSHYQDSRIQYLLRSFSKRQETCMEVSMPSSAECCECREIPVENIWDSAANLLTDVV